MPALGTLTGDVTASPTCPVQSVTNPCPPAPVSATVTATSPTGAVAGTTRTDSTGGYTLSLPAGTYTVTASPGTTFPRCPTVQATVIAGQTTTTDIGCDTGIR